MSIIAKYVIKSVFNEMHFKQTANKISYCIVLFNISPNPAEVNNDPLMSVYQFR